MNTSRQTRRSLMSFLKGYRGFRATVGGMPRIPYERISIDSRTLQPGDIFVALRGERHDGHDYIRRALRKGAAAVVVEETWFREANHSAYLHGYMGVVVQDTLDFLQQLSAFHRRLFSIPVIGLTGSNGKTTTREMMAQILATRYRVLRSQGNRNNHIGLPLTLLGLTGETEIAVVEMGTNHPGEIALLTSLAAPTAAAVTNIGRGHIGFFGSLEAVYREKVALFDGVDADAPIFINMDDPFLREYPREHRRVVTVGSSQTYDVWGRMEGMDRFGRVRFSLNGRTPIQLNLPGKHQFSNALLAAAVGLHFGVEEEAIREALEKFVPAGQRMEIQQRKGVVLINDAYNANPDSMRAAVDYLVGLDDSFGKRILALGDMLELGDFAEQEHRELGRYIAEKPVNGVVLYGPLAKFIQQGIEESGNEDIKVFWYEDHKSVARRVKKLARKGDVVLFKGSRGMRMEHALEWLLALL
ncbi:MAG: UDP-N-acetylmuramoyl-tripeptide--D-alanyl-D-alanine ligase [Calditrichaeota bacterium]|nr:MAG: UDP-N-acetylmuramoyl-tripeptide--D-alanyl-D-alanine ligase [Calditrichota bacterium]